MAKWQWNMCEKHNKPAINKHGSFRLRCCWKWKAFNVLVPFQIENNNQIPFKCMIVIEWVQNGFACGNLVTILDNRTQQRLSLS